MRRQSKRPSVLIAATIHIGDERILGRVRNVSTGGMMIECGRRFHKGEAITVECNKFGAFDGHVVWSEGGRVGMAFEHPIDVATFGLPANDFGPDILGAGAARDTAKSGDGDAGVSDAGVSDAGAPPASTPATPGTPSGRHGRPTRLFGGKPLNRWVY